MFGTYPKLSCSYQTHVMKTHPHPLWTVNIDCAWQHVCSESTIPLSFGDTKRDACLLSNPSSEEFTVLSNKRGQSNIVLQLEGLITTTAHLSTVYLTIGILWRRGILCSRLEIHSGDLL